MKAILEYGRFTDMIVLPEVRPFIYIMKPTEVASFIPFPDDHAPEDKFLTKLEFELAGSVYDDILPL